MPSVIGRAVTSDGIEPHDEPERPQVLDDVVSWLRERATLPAQPNTASGERLQR